MTDPMIFAGLAHGVIQTIQKNTTFVSRDESIKIFINKFIEKCDYSLAKLISKDNTRKVAIHRHMLCYYLYNSPVIKDVCGHISLYDIKTIIFRDHTTILSSIKRCNEYLTVPGFEYEKNILLKYMDI